MDHGENVHHKEKDERRKSLNVLSRRISKQISRQTSGQEDLNPNSRVTSPGTGGQGAPSLERRVRPISERPGAHLGFGPPMNQAIVLPIRSPLRTGPRPLGIKRSSLLSTGEGMTTELRGPPLPRPMLLLCSSRTWRRAEGKRTLLRNWHAAQRSSLCRVCPSDDRTQELAAPWGAHFRGGGRFALLFFAPPLRAFRSGLAACVSAVGSRIRIHASIGREGRTSRTRSSCQM